jgi:hypothetical protein
VNAKSLRSATILFASATTIGGIAFWLLNWNPMYGADTDTKSLSQSAIERLGGFRFPVAANNVHSRYVNWLDYDLWVRFDLPPTARDEFISHLVTAPTTDTMMGEMSADDRMPWWTPPTGVHVEEMCRRGGGVRQHILIDQRDAWRLVVYLYAANDEDSKRQSPSTAASTGPS